MELPKNPTECAFHVESNTVCMEDDVIDILKKFIIEKKYTNKTEIDNENVIDKLKDVYDCDSEICLLTKSEIIEVIGSDTASKQIESQFKHPGPTDKAKWLSNIDIEAVLRQIEKKYKNKNFKHVPFQMRDFQETGGKLATIDFVKEYNNGIRCFGVVFNDDTSKQPGSHWTAMFGDFQHKVFTLEHFNSSGAGPKNEMREWMYKTKHILEKNLNVKCEVNEVSKIQHQTDNSSCGPYSLYYIISRLEGIPHTFFEKHRVPDKVMWNFRHHIFRAT